MDYDFILYFNKVVQLDQFASLILAQSAQVVPAEVRAMADELRNVTQTEIAVLHERHKYAEYHKKRMEGALLNSPNADGIGKGIASVTYGETEEYTPSELATHWGVPEGFLSVLVTMDALSVRRTGAGKLDFMISKQMADRFAATKSGRNMLESMRSRAT
jgi:hypothetical protein